MLKLQNRLNRLRYFNNGKFKYEQGNKTFSLSVTSDKMKIELNNHDLNKLGAGLELVKHHLGDEFETIRKEIMQ